MQRRVCAQRHCSIKGDQWLKRHKIELIWAQSLAKTPMAPPKTQKWLVKTLVSYSVVYGVWIKEDALF